MLLLFGEEEDSLKWEIKTLTIDSNEGIDIADFNNDGRLDVVAGRNWYAAPDFIPRPVRTIEDWNDYVLSNGDFALDVNGDGWLDVISGAFNLLEVCWYENPGDPQLEQGKLWEKHLFFTTSSTENEGQFLYDLNKDGIPEWIVSSWNPNNPLLVWKLSIGPSNQPSAESFIIGKERNGHGLGFGDLNGDNKPDLLFEFGWYEQPEAGPFSGPWQFHNDWEYHASLPILVDDLNQDGWADVIVGQGHDYGLYWLEQRQVNSARDSIWIEHLIDNSFSQPHSLLLVDLNADGSRELVVGKRVLAHNGNDPGAHDPPCIYYYEWQPDKLEFSRHTINEGQVGGGLQIRAADLNGDRFLDIAVAGKSGTYILFNKD
jgi:hypothetical protein